jgi:hypothetical protein
MNGSYANSRTIARETLETRMLDGLRDRLMAPQIAAEAMRAFAEETNRLNRERRPSGGADRKALAHIEEKLKEIVTFTTWRPTRISHTPCGLRREYEKCGLSRTS